MSRVPTARKATKILPGQKNDIENSKPVSKNQDSRLVEIINTAIVDRSPAVKWDDVGMKLLDHN